MVRVCSMLCTASLAVKRGVEVTETDDELPSLVEDGNPRKGGGVCKRVSHVMTGVRLPGVWWVNVADVSG